MQNKGLISITLCCVGLLTIVLLALKLTSVEAGTSFQTWPSRTPTPGPGETQPPGGSTPGGGQATPGSGQATPSSQTPTATLVDPSGSPVPPASNQPSGAETGVPTSNDLESGQPESGTDEIIGSGVNGPESTGRCDIPPVIQALGPVSVRLRAGIDQEIIGYLQYSDLRTIIGRTDSAPWWFIIFDSDTSGWVADQAVAVHGFTGYVPIIESESALEAQSIVWNPTPSPQCTPPALSVVSEAGTLIETEVNSDKADEGESAGNEQQNSLDEASEPENEPGEEQASALFDIQQNESQSNSSPITWLLITGVFLIVVGTVSLFIRRRNY